MTSIKEATPAKNYKDLLTQFYAMRHLLSSQEGVISSQYEKINLLEEKLKLFNYDEYNQKLELIEKLTNEIERLENDGR